MTDKKRPPKITKKVAAPSAHNTVLYFPRRRWALEDNSSSLVVAHPSTTSSFHAPVGFVGNKDFSVEEFGGRKDQKENKDELVRQSAMAMATQPGKQLLMTAFMLWMAGSSLQIFSIMMLGMAVVQPIRAIMGYKQQFTRYEDSNVDVSLAKLVFIVLNLAGLGMGLYKAQTMGLLPSSVVLHAPFRQAVEVGVGSVIS